MVSDKTISTKRGQLIGTLTSSSPSLSTLSLDLIHEIFSRLPVKFLVQLQCVCKSWKSLVSDPKFAKKHLSLSTTYTLHCISYFYKISHKHVIKSYSLDSILTNITQTQFPSNGFVSFVGSCNGILCLVRKSVDLVLVQLWNPSIRKFKELPPVSEPPNFRHRELMIKGFGYDPISDHYKVVFVFGDIGENEVKVHTLGTNSWETVSEFPFAIVDGQVVGQYVSGTINWLVSTSITQSHCFTASRCFIASFDLGNESYQKVLLPDDSGEVDEYELYLSVFRDCLCLIFGEDVWVMKEYRNKKSWTKLFTISYMGDPWTSSYSDIQPMYVFEDDQVLLECKGNDMRWEYISYNCKNNTSKFIESEISLEVCIESLISPCL